MASGGLLAAFQAAAFPVWEHSNCVLVCKGKIGIFECGIEEDQEYSGLGAKGDFSWFSGVAELGVEILEMRVDGCQGALHGWPMMIVR